MRSVGSSPLARGLQVAGEGWEVSSGIIPARAGFTCVNARESGTEFGSSPLARGLRLPVGGGEVVGGIIPARAGFTMRASCSPSSAQQPGIIPARAGFTWSASGTSPNPRDHPRSRGVYTSRGRGVPVWGGSSPLARGLRAPLAGAPVACGIIPARAGFTPQSMCSHLLYDGSSPLARGLRCRHSSILLTVRIIPARAGFTTSAPLTSAPGSDHPRSRGVYVLPPLAAIIGVMDHPRSRGVYGGLFTPGRRKAGSSPLARGLRTSSSSPGRGGRIIPARAGFTR